MDPGEPTRSPSSDDEINDLFVEKGAETWDALSERLQSFLDAWDQGEEPPLADHLPKQSSLRRLTLIELIKIDLERRYECEATLRPLEFYQSEFPELLGGESNVPTDLIYEEFHVRKAAGEDVRVSEYLQRFPEHAEELKRLFAVETGVASMSIRDSIPAPPLDAGTEVDDFQILMQLGKGAFGTVYLARQTSMQRLVALKVSRKRGAEAQTIAQLDHPGVVRVYDQRLLPDNTNLLYMQYVAGGTMHDVIARLKKTSSEDRDGSIAADSIRHALDNSGGFATGDSSALRKLESLTWPQLVGCWGAHLAQALDHAHEHQVLHRDIKPANVLVGADGLPRLADFNISYGSSLEGATAAAFFGGSLAYMSPEQLEACCPQLGRAPEDLDCRSDIYSLGLVLAELLTGDRPFRDERVDDSWATTIEALVARRSESVQLPRPEPGDDVTLRLIDILERCLAPDPADRFASGAELAAEIQLCLQPRAATLLERRDSGWLAIVRRHPVVSIVMAGLLPNALAGVFNLYYNLVEIVERQSELTQAFWVLQFVINAIAFPIGIAILAAFTWPLGRGCRVAETKPDATPADLRQLRRRALNVGHITALIGIGAWTIAGLAYPLSLHMLLGELSLTKYVHFLASLVLSGLIASSHPFFLTATLSLRALYPPLLREGETTDDDREALQSLSRWSGVYLLAAGGVPALAVMALVAFSVFNDSPNVLALLVCSALGTVGFGVAFWLYRDLQRDCEALGNWISPPESRL